MSARLVVRKTPAERLGERLVTQPNGCIEWTGATNKKGYGSIGDGNGKTMLTHRLAWELANGPIPEGMKVLHHCDNPPCCNVEKCLFLGTDADNSDDKWSKGRGNNGRAQRADCLHGHSYDELNTQIDKYGYRHCRACWRDQAVARYHKRATGEVLEEVTV